VASADVVAPGSDYRTDWLAWLSLIGGTALKPATIIVYTTSDGKLENDPAPELNVRGQYTETPSNPVATNDILLHGVGGTLNLTWQGCYSSSSSSLGSYDYYTVADAEIVDQGENYASGDQAFLSVLGGETTEPSLVAVYTTETGKLGALEAIFDGGYFTVIPSNPVSTSDALSGGSGGTLNITWQGYFNPSSSSSS
jgi:hypothetical protein